jgi:Xaa-Pro aminopeptidase
MKTKLIVANSEHDANLLYATGLFAPDPFVLLEVRGKRYVVVNDLEIGRARKQATVDRVLSYNRYLKRLKQQGIPQPRQSDVVRLMLKEFHVRAVAVPSDFPIGLAKRLRGIRIRVIPEPFFSEREVKTPQEMRKITRALWMAEEGMRAAMDALHACRVGRDGFLYRHGRKVTSEHIQGVIGATVAGLGGVSARTIVAGGNQGCDPHEVGHGPLRAHQPIIVDVFPRDMTTGYHGDITRTVVRGRASDAVRKLWLTVEQAQEMAFGKLRAGVDGRDVHRAVMDLFKNEGYPTGQHRGQMRGFFHSTGHGLGLDVHETPRLSAVSALLKAGHVITVEPGLYYRGIGGVRLEDVAVIGPRHARILTAFPKLLEI